jgi:hypothetical protein
VRNRTVLGVIVGTAVALFISVAPAAAQGTVGAGISFLHDSGQTAPGFAIDYSADVRKMEKVAWGGVGDFSLYRKNGVTDTFYQGGVRITGTGSAKVRPYGQVLLGGARFSITGFSENAFVFTVGGGADVPLNAKANFRVALDFPTVRSNGVSSTDTRFTFGVSFPVGTR